MKKEFSKKRNKINFTLTPILEDDFGIYLNFQQMDAVIKVIEHFHDTNMKDPEWIELIADSRESKKKQNKNDKAMTKLESENISLKQENKELKSLMKDIANFLSNKEENQQLKTG